MPGAAAALALVIVIDELDRTPEQAALGVDLFFPDLHAEQRLLAVGGERTGERHGETDLDRLALGACACAEPMNGSASATTAPQQSWLKISAEHISKHRLFLPGVELLIVNFIIFYAHFDPKSQRFCMPTPCPHLVASPPSTMMVSTSPAPLRRKAAACSYSGEVKQATPCSRVGKLDHNKTMEFFWPFHDLVTPTPRQNLPTVLADDRGHEIGVFLVLDRIVDLRAGNPISRHVFPSWTLWSRWLRLAFHGSASRSGPKSIDASRICSCPSPTWSTSSSRRRISRPPRTGTSRCLACEWAPAPISSFRSIGSISASAMFCTSRPAART